MTGPYPPVSLRAGEGTLGMRAEDRGDMNEDGEHRREEADAVAHRLEDADTLTDLGAVVPRELLEAARDELLNPADESDEG
jgi:hypothetical protein